MTLLMDNLTGFLVFSVVLNVAMIWAWWDMTKMNESLIDDCFFLMEEVCSLEQKLKEKENSVA